MIKTLPVIFLFIVGIIGAIMFLGNDNLQKTGLFSTSKPTTQDLKKEYQRRYPLSIKAINSQNATLKDIKKATDIGLNTVVVTFVYTHDVDSKLEVIEDIKDANLAVYLLVEDSSEEYTDIDISTAARIAEEYKVEYLGTTTQWDRDTSEKVREMFKGKTVYHNKESTIPNIENYDYLGTTVDTSGKTSSEFRQYVRQVYSQASKATTVANNDWFVAEYTGDKTEEYFETTDYEYTIFNGQKTPKGFGITSLDTAPLEKLKKFFAKI